MDTIPTPTTKPARRIFQSSPALKNSRLMLTLVVAGLFLFLIMWISMASQTLFYHWDAPVNAYFTQLKLNFSEGATSFVRLFGKAGSQGITAVTILMLTVWALRRQFRQFWLMFAAVVGVEFLWLPVVFGIGRPRPQEVRAVGDILLPGFPSGHVMIFIAFFGALLYLYFMNVRNRTWRVLIVVLLIFLFFLTGLVRLYFNAHYLTDVLGGYGLGLAWTAFALFAVEWVFLQRRQKEGRPE